MGRLERLKKNLFAAIGRHDLEKVQNYIEMAKKIKRKDEVINSEKYGMKPIHLAVYVGNFEVSKFLLNNGADTNVISHIRLAPFPHVTTTIMRIAYNCASSTDSQVMQGFTALHLAFFCCQSDIARLLLDNKDINTDIVNVDGKTAFEVIQGYENLCGDGCEIQKILPALLKLHKNNCEALLTSAKISTKVELKDGNAIDMASSTVNSFLTPTKANISIELGASDTTDVASNTVNSSFTSTKANLKEASGVASSTVKPSSFINYIFNWITTATFGQNTPALPLTQQPVAREVDFSGTTLLADLMVRKFTGKKYSRPLDDSLLTVEQIKERKLNPLERNVKAAISKLEKLYQCPGSSLSNSTVYKGMYQKSL